MRDFSSFFEGISTLVGIYIDIRLLFKKSLISFIFTFSSFILIILSKRFDSICSFNSAFAKYEYNSSVKIPLKNIDLIERFDFLLLELFSSNVNKNLGNPSFFFSL